MNRSIEVTPARQQVAFFLPIRRWSDTAQQTIEKTTEAITAEGLTCAVRTVDAGNTAGYGAAIRGGLADALETGSNLIGYMDADGRFDPADFRRLLRVMIGHRYDAVSGVRSRQPNRFKRHNTATARPPLSASNYGFYLLKRTVVEAIVPQLRSSTDFVSTEIIHRVRQAGMDIGIVPIARPVSLTYAGGVRAFARPDTYRDIYRLYR